jgi:hypothetical protein
MFFLKTFNEIAEEFRWSEGAKLIWLRSRLAGDAKKLWETLNQIETVDFKKITEQLLELYGSVGSKYSATKLTKIIAEPSESINSLKFRIENAVKNYLKDSLDLTSETGQKAVDKLAFTQLIEALQPKYRECIMREGATSFQQGVEIARKEQNLIQEMNKFNDKTIQETAKNTALDELIQIKDREIEELKESINALKFRPQTVYGKNEKNTIICFFCNKQGHRKSECRWYQKEMMENNKRTDNYRDNVTKNYGQGNKKVRQFDNRNATGTKLNKNHFLG